jgi:hypothetical protein
VGYTKFEIELALFEIFRDFTWREVDVIEEYNLPELNTGADNLEDDGDDFVVDFGADIFYMADPHSEKNKMLLKELESVASKHGLEIALDLPNNDFLCDISTEVVDIEVSKDWNGKWRIQPNFSMRIPSNELVEA